MALVTATYRAGHPHRLRLQSDSSTGAFQLPFISVVVPTHNRPEMLAEALASVRAQTFTDYEIIIVSNGEDDIVREKSLAVATEYGAQYFALAAGNVSAARNFGIEQAKGEWIALLDDDDLWLPQKLERQFADARRTGADLISGDWIKFFPDGSELIEQHRLPEGWSALKAISGHRWGCLPSAALVRKSALKFAGGFDPRQRFNEDNDMWRRVLLRGGVIHHAEEVLTRYRCGHPALTSPRNIGIRILYDLRFSRKAFFDRPLHSRSDLPPLWSLMPPRLTAPISKLWTALIPKLLRQPFHLERMRRRWKALTRWMAQTANH
jgi:glycosyltransferase involved in cell wall biosynthesis